MVEKSLANFTQDSPHIFRWQDIADIEYYGDEAKLERAMINLLSNAVKYSPRESPITVSAAIDKFHLLISVRDHGIGIEKREQDQVFKEFYRVDTSSLNAGLGLGLFIASSIVKAHDGLIEIESEPGRGSVFSMILPIAR